jgi:hypothetical protein
MRTANTEIRLTGEYMVKALQESDEHIRSGIVKLTRAALGLKELAQEQREWVQSFNRREA